MRSEERCDRCNKFTMVGVDNGSALLFAHQWCKCSEERENAVSDNPRDTQFQGFADIVWDEIMKTMMKSKRHIDVGTDPAIYRKIIARRAYDFAYHMALHFDEKDFDVLGFDEALARIPDMTELPKEQE